MVLCLLCLNRLVKEAASRIGVVSGETKIIFDNSLVTMTYKEFLTVLNLYYFSLCLDDSFQLYLITIVYVQLELYLLPQIVFSKLMALEKACNFFCAWWL
jgi:hypothetical protein